MEDRSEIFPYTAQRGVLLLTQVLISNPFMVPEKDRAKTWGFIAESAEKTIRYATVENGRAEIHLDAQSAEVCSALYRLSE